MTERMSPGPARIIMSVFRSFVLGRSVGNDCVGAFTVSLLKKGYDANRNPGSERDACVTEGDDGLTIADGDRAPSGCAELCSAKRLETPLMRHSAQLPENPVAVRAPINPARYRVGDLI